MAKTAVRTASGVTVGGMAKGAGMLAPALATMLCVLTTDAVADAADPRRRAARGDPDHVRPARHRRLPVDQRHRAAAGQRRVRRASSPADELTELVRGVCDDLAGQLLADAEGAEQGGPRRGHAEPPPRPTRSRSAGPSPRSALLKCALAGEDPNWGRVLSAVGTTAAAFDPLDARRRDQRRPGLPGQRAGGAARGRRPAGRRIDITVDLKAGDAILTVRTTDLTEAYVHENSAYST